MGTLIRVVTFAWVARNVFRKNANQPRFSIGCSVELCGRYRLDTFAMRLKLSRQIPHRAAGRPTGQVKKCGPADLALHNLLAISHRELERHQVSIIPNSLTSLQRHGPASFPWSNGADCAHRSSASIQPLLARGVAVAFRPYRGIPDGGSSNGTGLPQLNFC